MINIAHDIFPYLREYKDGTVERLTGTDIVPPGLDPNTGVTSYDVEIIPPDTHSSSSSSSISARIYDPATKDNHRLLPLLIYFHGGAFLIATSGEPRYHNFLNRLSSSTNALVFSVDYRLAPEHPLPAAFDDAWGTIQWVAAQRNNTTPPTDTAEELVNSSRVDFSRVFIVGDSAGATLGHHMGCQLGLDHGLMKLKGIVHIHPYFWGKVRIGYEVMDERREMVDSWWDYVCQTDQGSDDPLINPFVEGAPKMEKLECERLLVCVAEKDVLRDRGVAYHRCFMDMIKDEKWNGMRAELFQTKGEDHVFHIFDLDSVKSRNLMDVLVNFINRD